MVRVEFSQAQLVEFCQKWQVTELALFGSVLRANFRPESDVDVLVSFAPEAKHSLFDFYRMQQELEKLVGRKVDLVSRRGLETSRNYLRRQAILESAQVVYSVAG